MASRTLKEDLASGAGPKAPLPKLRSERCVFSTDSRGASDRDFRLAAMTNRHRHYILFMVTLVFVVNYLDRQVLASCCL